MATKKIDFSGLSKASESSQKSYDIKKQNAALQKKISFASLANPSTMPQYKEPKKSKGLKALSSIMNLVDLPRAAIVGGIASGMNLIKTLKPSVNYDYIKTDKGSIAGPLDPLRAFNLVNGERVFFSDIYNSLIDNADNQPTKTTGASKFWKHPLTRMGVGLLGDIVLDPLTYISLGISASAKGVIQGGRLGVGALSKTGMKTSSSLITKLSSKLGNTLPKTLASNADNIAERVVSLGFKVAESGDIPRILNSATDFTKFAEVVMRTGAADNLTDAITLSAKLLRDLKKANTAKLFDKGLVRIADWIPGLGGKTIIKKPYSGTFTRMVGELDTQVPRTLGAAMEKAIANKFPKFAKFANKASGLVTNHPKPFGQEDVGGFLQAKRLLQNYDSVTKFRMGQEMDLLKNTYYKFATDNGLDKNVMNELIRTRELLVTKKYDKQVIKAFDKLLNNTTPIKGTYKKSLIKDLASQFQTSTKEITDMADLYKLSKTVKGKKNIAMAQQAAWEKMKTIGERFAQADYADAIKDLSPAKRKFLDMAEESYKETHQWLVDAGVVKPGQYIQGYVSHTPILPEGYGAKGKIIDTGRDAYNLTASTPFSKTRKFDTIETMEKKVGGLRNIDLEHNIAYNRLKTVNTVETQKVLTKIKDTFGIDPNVKDIKFPVNTYIDPLTKQKVLLPSYVYDMVSKYNKVFQMTDETNYFLKWFDKVQGLWKGYVTATPGFTGRNVLFGNSWAGYLEHGWDYFDPRTFKDGVYTFMAQFPDMVSKYKPLQGKAKNGKYYTELARMANENGIFRTGQAGYDVLAKVSMFEEFERLMRGKKSVLNTINPFDQQNFYLKTFRNMNSAAEDVSKAMSYVLEVGKQGGDYIGAAQRTKLFFFDYTDLTIEEMQFGRRIAPFYTWMRKNIPLQIEQMLIQTGKYKVFPLGKKYLEDLSENGAPDESHLPDYMQERYWMRTPIMDKWGNYLYFNPNFPPQDLAILFNPKDALGMLTPLLKIPLELGLNKNLYFDSPIKATDYSWSYGPTWMKKLPKGLQDVMGIETSKDGKNVYMSPYMKYLTDQIPQLKIINNMFFNSPDSEKYKTPSLQTLQSFVGFKFMPYREEDEKLKYEYDLRDHMMQYLRAIEQLGYNTEESMINLKLNK